MAQVTVRNHDPANVKVILREGAPPEPQPPDDLQARLDAYVTATRADAQRIYDRSAPGNKPQAYVKATKADAQLIIDRVP